MHKQIPPTGNPRGRSSLLTGCDNRSFSLQGRAPLPMPSAMGGTVFHEPAQGVTWSYSDLCPRPSAVALASPLKCLYYSISCPGCQALFWTFFIFFGSAPSIRAEVVRRHPTACAALCLLFITRVMGRPFKHRYQRCDFIGLTAHCCDLPPTHLRREALFTPRVCGVFLPLCDFSIPQSLDFVKHFF